MFPEPFFFLGYTKRQQATATNWAQHAWITNTHTLNMALERACFSADGFNRIRHEAQLKEDENPAGSDVSYLTRVSVRPTWAFAHNKVLGWRRKREEFLLAVSHFHFHYFAHASTWKTFIPVVLCGHKRLIRIFRLGFVSITFRALNLIIKKCAFFFWCDSSDGGQQMRAAGVELWEERGREIRGE